MATNKQRREAARRQLQRQLERRAEDARKRRRNLFVGVAAFTVFIVVGGVLWFTGVFDDEPATDPAASTDTEAVACTYSAADAAANPNLVEVGVPPEPDPDDTTPVVLDVESTQGAFQMTLDPATAPCAANSMKYLATNAFFDGSICHRLVNSDVFGVLQCGDPSGTGSGGPTYSYVSEPDSVANLAPAPDGASSIYPRGSVAMAQGGQPATIGSQFFICFQDTQLPPDYTLVGTVTSGLEVIEAVAAGGNDGSFETNPDGSPGPGGGAPLLPITLTTVTVAPGVA